MVGRDAPGQINICGKLKSWVTEVVRRTRRKIVGVLMVAEDRGSHHSLNPSGAVVVVAGDRVNRVSPTWCYEAKGPPKHGYIS